MDALPGKSDCPQCQRLWQAVEQLEKRVEALEAENRALRAENRQLREDNKALREDNKALREQLDQSRRAGKRQAAPFRKPKVKNPKRPGRKQGDDYGEHHRRAVPETINETYDVPLPECCPDCSSRHLEETGITQQYQTDFEITIINRQFNIHRGLCSDCGSPLQGQHDLQTSDALGAAGVQFGAKTHATLALLNKEYGLSHGKIAKLLGQLFGINVARGTSARSMLRTAKRLKPAYEQIKQVVRGSPVVVPDETGWRIGGENAWLHVFVGEKATCYDIAATRRADPLADVIGWDYDGVLIHDGWSVYDQFYNARHQQCLAHLLRRCHDLLESAMRGAVRFPRAVKALLQAALCARDKYSAGLLTERGLKIVAGRLQAQMQRLVKPVKVNDGNERLAAFLERHAKSLFTFLQQPGVEATNYRAEQAIRPAVVNRKVWGGNRTKRGARAQSVIMSVLRTDWQNDINSLTHLTHILQTGR